LFITGGGMMTDGFGEPQKTNEIKPVAAVIPDE
jgi:hypothetical protein